MTENEVDALIDNLQGITSNGLLNEEGLDKILRFALTNLDENHAIDAIRDEWHLHTREKIALEITRK